MNHELRTMNKSSVFLCEFLKEFDLKFCLIQYGEVSGGGREKSGFNAAKSLKQVAECAILLVESGEKT